MVKESDSEYDGESSSEDCWSEGGSGSCDEDIRERVKGGRKTGKGRKRGSREARKMDDGFKVFEKWYVANRGGRYRTEMKMSTDKSRREVADAWNELDESGRERYRREAEAMESGEQNEGERERSTVKSKVVYYSRCCPQQIMRLVRKMGQNTQVRNIISEMGFEAFSEVRCGNMPKRFMMKLLGHFDPFTCELVIRGQRQGVSGEDVAELMGLPNGPNPVVYDQKVGKEVAKGLAEQLKKIEKDKVCKGGENVSAEDKSPGKKRTRRLNFRALKDVLLSEGMEDKVTKQAFLLLALGCVLCPTSSQTPSPQMYSVVGNVEDVRKFKWGDFVLQWLCQEIQAFSLGERKRICEGGKRSIGGCLLFLMIFYFERCPFIKFEKRPSDVHPLMFWDKVRVRRRIAMEHDYANYNPEQAIGHHISQIKNYVPSDGGVGCSSGRCSIELEELTQRIVQKHISALTAELRSHISETLVSTKKSKRQKLGRRFEGRQKCEEDPAEEWRSAERKESNCEIKESERGERWKGQIASKGTDRESSILVEQYTEERKCASEGTTTKRGETTNENGIPVFGAPLNEIEREESLIAVVEVSGESEQQNKSEEKSCEMSYENKGESRMNEKKTSLETEGRPDDREHSGKNMENEDEDMVEEMIKSGRTTRTWTVKKQDGGQLTFESPHTSERPAVRKRKRRAIKATLDATSQAFDVPTLVPNRRLSQKYLKLYTWATRGPGRGSNVENNPVVVVIAKVINLYLRDLRCLAARQRISNVVVDAHAALLNYRQKKAGRVWKHYFSPFFTVSIVAAAGGDVTDNVIGRPWDPMKHMQYLGEHNVGYSIFGCDMLFIPIVYKEHWMLFVTNIRDRRIDVLDSQADAHVADRATLLPHIVAIMSKAFSHVGRQEYDFNLFPINLVSVPQQENNYDCGIFVMKFMETWEGTTLAHIDPKTHIFGFRKEYVICLIDDPENEVREETWALVGLK